MASRGQMWFWTLWEQKLSRDTHKNLYCLLAFGMKCCLVFVCRAGLPALEPFHFTDSCDYISTIMVFAVFHLSTFFNVKSHILVQRWQAVWKVINNKQLIEDSLSYFLTLSFFHSLSFFPSFLLCCELRYSLCTQGDSYTHRFTLPKTIHS